MSFRIGHRPTHRANRPTNLQRIRSGKRWMGIGVSLFGLIFVTIGALATWFMSAGVWKRAIDAPNWHEVEAVIVSSEVAVSRGSDSTTYRPEIVFRYEWEGQPYTADTWGFMSVSSGKGWAEGKVAAYPAGSRHPAWVNPADPADAVLERGFSAWLLLSLLPLIFCVVGVFIVGWGAYLFLRGRKPRRVRRGDSLAEPSLRDHRLLGLPDLAAEMRRTGPVELQPTQGPLARMFGMAGFALIWNGITWTILGIIISEGRQRGSYEWFPILFLSMFALIGAAAVAAMLYYTYGFFFGPRLRVLASQTVLIPGKTWEVSWNFSRGVNRVREVRFVIEGVTEAEYTRGSGKNSSRVTDRKVFFHHDLFSSKDPGEFLRGSVRMDIPTDLPHSFVAGSNRIRYQLQGVAVASREPNLSQAYTVYVPPLAEITSSP